MQILHWLLGFYPKPGIDPPFFGQLLRNHPIENQHLPGTGFYQLKRERIFADNPTTIGD
jgi:hypothetical protein